MPGKVGKFILGAALIGAAFIPGLGTVAGVALKGLFLSTGLSFASTAAFQVLQTKQRQSAVFQNMPDPQSALPIVYGKTKLGLRIVDTRTFGGSNEELWIVGALCHGSEDGSGILAIDEIYFDERLAFDAIGTPQEPFVGKISVAKLLGTDAQNFANTAIDGTSLQARFVEWPGTSAGKGVVGIILKLTYDPEVFATGLPNVTVMVRGAKVNDPRNARTISAATAASPIAITATSHGFGTGDVVKIYQGSLMGSVGLTGLEGFFTITVTGANTFTLNGSTGTGAYIGGSAFAAKAAYSDNPALCLLDYLTSARYGVVLKEYETDCHPSAGSFSLMATYCATLLFKDGLNTGPRFNCNGWLDAGQESKQNLAMLQSSCRGNLIYQGGSYRLVIRQPVTPSATGISEDQILGGWSFMLPGVAQCPNVGHATYIEPGATQDFQAETTVWPRPGLANPLLVTDNGQEVKVDLELPLTTDRYTAEQIMMATIRELRAGIAAQFTCTEAVMKYQVGDVIPITHPTPGWTAQLFWITAMFLNPDSTVRVSVIGYDANAYTLDALSFVAGGPVSKLPNPYIVAPPTALQLTASDSEAYPDRDGTHRVYIRASWTGALDAYIDRYDVQYRVSGSSVYLPAPDQNRADLEALIGPVSEGVAYDIRVRAINTLGISSSWEEDSITPSFANLQRSGSFWIDDFSTQTPGRRWIPVGVFEGTLLDQYDPDSLVGGKVGRCTGPVWYMLADSIPYDPNLLYTVRWRVRQLRNPVVGGKELSLGVMGLAEIPGQTGVYVYMNRQGGNTADNQHWVVAESLELVAGRSWTDFFGHFKGYAGGKVGLLSSMVSHSGLASFSAANLTDGDTTPSKTGFSTDAAVAGAYLRFDLGVPKFITEARFHMSAEGSLADWELEFSDDDATWTAVT